MRRSLFLIAVTLLAIPLLATPMWAEPYLAGREGLKCMACHVNTSGGGMRNAFGNAYVQTAMAAEHIQAGSEQWNELFTKVLRLGGDLRGIAENTEIPHQEDTNTFETAEVRLYAAADLIPQRLLLYVDQHLAPGSSINREAWLRVSSNSGIFQLKAGKFYLPYGLRLEDDTAYIREVTGINFNTPDKGVEFGMETGLVSAQLAVTNGTAGTRDNDEGKQVSLRTAVIGRLWRVGGSANRNHTDFGDRTMYNGFATLRTGPITWLGEYDFIDDETIAGGGRELEAALLEGNIAWTKGHNLKLSVEYLDPDTDVDEDEQNRYSIVNEYTPFQFLQFRFGARIYDGIPQNDLQNRKLYFLELHGFF